jgi:ABC-type polysaccharide/polyol phosphate export permease
MLGWLCITGIPEAIFFLWWKGAGRGLGYWVALVLIAFLVSYIAGLIMWRFFSPIRERAMDSMKATSSPKQEAQNS